MVSSGSKDERDEASSQSVDDVLSLAEAAGICGICAHTLAQQAEKGKLRGRKVGRTWLTTRQWLAEYLRAHARRRALAMDDGEAEDQATDP